MEKTLKFYGLWILIWALIIVAAAVDIFESSSVLDFLTIIFGIFMIYHNYNNYRKTTPKNGKNGDIFYGQI